MPSASNNLEFTQALNEINEKLKREQKSRDKEVTNKWELIAAYVHDHKRELKHKKLDLSELSNQAQKAIEKTEQLHNSQFKNKLLAFLNQEIDDITKAIESTEKPVMLKSPSVRFAEKKDYVEKLEKITALRDSFQNNSQSVDVYSMGGIEALNHILEENKKFFISLGNYNGLKHEVGHKKQEVHYSHFQQYFDFQEMSPQNEEIQSQKPKRKS